MSDVKQSLATTTVERLFAPPPLSAAADSESDGEDASSASRALLGRFTRALVVDDDAPLRRALSRLLRAARIEVSEAKTVAEGTDLLAREPDLVITDVRLPDGSGRRIVELAQQHRPAPLIIVMSGLASAPEAFALSQCGASVYLSKPFAHGELLDGIATMCAEGSERSVAPLANDPNHDLQQCLLSFANRYSVPDREMALVQLATAGVPRARCPEMLSVSENTCKTLTRRLLQRCGARSLAQIPRLVLIGELPDA